MRKLTLLLLGFLLFSAQVWAQRTITGKVTDDKGNPIPNASVLVKGTTTGTTTKADGSYSISVPANAKSLVISSVNMESSEIAIGSQSSVNVSLKLDDKSLSEVVVTGYSREKKTQFTGAATVLSSKVVETVPVGSFDQALQGRAPGVQVNSASGQPGASASITIRGMQSLQGAGTQPLFVIDGIPMPALDMQTINPNDFETITVLKDAGASALYGARAGVGVIVITTKKGKAGTSNFMYRTQIGFTQPPTAKKFDMMNTEEILFYEERQKLAGTPGWNYSKNNPAYAALPATSPTNNPYAASQARYDFLLDSIRNIDTDYGDLLFRQGFSQLHELNFSGGSDKTRFFLSGAFFDQKGTDLSSRLKRYTTRFNLDHTIDKLTVSFTMAAGYSITNLSEGEFLGNSARNSFQMSWRAKPYENPYGGPGGSLIFGANTTLALKQIGNVIEGIENSLWRQNQIKINTGLTLSYRLLPFVTLKNTVGIDVADDRWQRYIRPFSYIGSLQTNNNGINSEAYKINAQLINTSSVIYAQRFNNRHDVEVGAFFEVVRGWQKGLGFTLLNLDGRIEQTGQGAGTLPVPTGATTYPQTGTSAKSQFGIRSYFATARYTYNNKYTLTANVRRDGTSRILNEDNNEVTTFAVGGIWNAIQENFMKQQNVLTDLKIRASFGSVPNIGSIATATYAAGGGLITVTNWLGPQVPGYATTNAFLGSPVTGQVPTTVGNPNLKIETIDKLNIGFDFAFWKNRARFTVDLYKNLTKQLFVNRILGATTGFPGVALPINAGTMSNKGIEFLVNVDIIKQRDIDLTLGMNHAINKNRVEDLGGVPEYFLGTFLIREGLPYGSHYTVSYLGADPATGRPTYERQDGTITTDFGQAGRFTKFGTFLPVHVGGFTSDFRYKNLTISTLWSYQFDVVRNNNIENWVTRGTPGYHTAVNASRRLLTMQWQKPGDIAYYQSSAYDRDFTSADLQDAKFLRFRNLNVGYNIPQINVKGMRMIKSARFYVQLQNVAIWSPWRGPDPEDNNNISLNEFPNPRMFVTGIDINF